MKVWDSDIGSKMAEFLTERGVDMPRAWSIYCRQENCVNDRARRSFAQFLKQNYPVEMTAWRLIGA